MGNDVSSGQDNNFSNSFPLFQLESKSYSHGGSDSIAIKRRQQQLGRMADFLPSVTFSVFDL